MGGTRPHTPPAASRASPPPDTHPHDHHLDGHVLGEADRGPEVHGQGHEEMEDGHQVLPVNCLSGEGRGSCFRSGFCTNPEPRSQRQ